MADDSIIRPAGEMRISPQAIRGNRCIPSDHQKTQQIEELLIKSGIPRALELADLMSKNCWGGKRLSDTSVEIKFPSLSNIFILTIDKDGTTITRVMKLERTERSYLEQKLLEWIRDGQKGYREEHPEEFPPHSGGNGAQG